MIETSVAVVQGLVALSKLRRAKPRRALFDDHIEPIFQDMLVVHADYLESITTFMSEVADKTGQDILHRIDERKNRLAGHRAMLMAFPDAFELEESRWPAEVLDFAHAVRLYFRLPCPPDYEHVHGTLYGTLRELVAAYQEGRKKPWDWGRNPWRGQDYPAEWFREELRNGRQSLEQAWAEVVRSYTQAKLALYV